jgi:hypothetical protein
MGESVFFTEKPKDELDAVGIILWILPNQSGGLWAPCSLFSNSILSMQLGFLEEILLQLLQSYCTY